MMGQRADEGILMPKSKGNHPQGVPALSRLAMLDVEKAVPVRAVQHQGEKRKN